MIRTQLLKSEPEDFLSRAITPPPPPPHITCCVFVMNIIIICCFFKDGYVVKTTDISSGLKAFVNICSNQHIGQSLSQYTEKEENGKK